MENYNEVEVMENEELENEAEIGNEKPVETDVKSQEQEVKKPGKVKGFFKGAWAVTKKVLPLGAAYSLGYATKAVIGKVTGKPATGSDIPAIPVKTETVDLGEGVKAEVTNF